MRLVRSSRLQQGVSSTPSSPPGVTSPPGDRSKGEALLGPVLVPFPKPQGQPGDRQGAKALERQRESAGKRGGTDGIGPGENLPFCPLLPHYVHATYVQIGQHEKRMATFC